MRKALLVIALFSLTASAAAAESSLALLQDDIFTDRSESDLNGDGVVDFLDLGVLRSQTNPAPDLERDALGASAPNVFFFTPEGQSSIVNSVSVTDQDTVFLDLQMSFGDTTVGGGIDLLYDAGVLTFVDAVFDDGLGDIPNFRCPTDPAAPAPIDCSLRSDDFVSFGSLSGITGDKLVATLEFSAIATGSSTIDFTVTSTFSDPVGQPLDVPEASFGWVAAMITLGALKRRQIMTRRV